MDKTFIGRVISKRAERLAKRVESLGIEKGGNYFIAGNSLNGVVRDIDIFPKGSEMVGISGEIVFQTKNAKTYKCEDGTLVQLCDYRHGSLEALVNYLKP